MGSLVLDDQPGEYGEVTAAAETAGGTGARREPLGPQAAATLLLAKEVETEGTSHLLSEACRLCQHWPLGMPKCQLDHSQVVCVHGCVWLGSYGYSWVCRYGMCAHVCILKWMCRCVCV